MTDGGPDAQNADEQTEVVQTAADAAADVIFDAYRTADVRDLDITVRFEEGVLEIDVYLNAPGDAQAVADEAARAAQAAVDAVLE